YNTLKNITELRSKVYLPGSDTYTDRIEIYFSKSTALEPWYIQALKRASTNLGLIIYFNILPIKLVSPLKGTIWGDNIIFKSESGNNLINTLVDFTNTIYKDKNSSVSISFLYQPKLAGGIIALVSIKNTLTISKLLAFNSFYGIRAILNNTIRINTILVLSRELSED
ncbi:unnamed protein product, partial [Clonostachys rhizophaga]